MKENQIFIPSINGVDCYAQLPFQHTDFCSKNHQFHCPFWVDYPSDVEKTEGYSSILQPNGEISYKPSHRETGVVLCFSQSNDADTVKFGKRKQGDNQVLTMDGEVVLFPEVKDTDEKLLKSFRRTLKNPNYANLVSLGQIKLPADPWLRSDEYPFDIVDCYQFHRKYYGYYKQHLYQLTPITVHDYMENDLISGKILFPSKRDNLEEFLNDTFLTSLTNVTMAIKANRQQQKLSRCIIAKQNQKNAEPGKAKPKNTGPVRAM